MKPSDRWKMQIPTSNMIRPGLFQVKGVGGILPIFNILGDRKRVTHQADHDPEGFNIMKGREWGYFQIATVGRWTHNDRNIGEDWAAGKVMRADICLNYNHPLNPSWIKGIRDYIRPMPGGWIGLMTLEGRTLGYFTLTKIGE